MQSYGTVRDAYRNLVDLLSIVLVVSTDASSVKVQRSHVKLNLSQVSRGRFIQRELELLFHMNIGFMGSMCNPAKKETVIGRPCIHHCAVLDRGENENRPVRSASHARTHALVAQTPTYSPTMPFQFLPVTAAWCSGCLQSSSFARAIFFFFFFWAFFLLSLSLFFSRLSFI